MEIQPSRVNIVGRDSGSTAMTPKSITYCTESCRFCCWLEGNIKEEWHIFNKIKKCFILTPYLY
ncbi:hypothetical protein O9992_00080 [Vibrio lentus]|nr:hypothetical protein [Vibrio lentus]